MTTEQLKLDFSEPELQEISQPKATAQVLDFRAARLVKQRGTLAQVYRSIHDSVSHIQIRKSPRHQDFESCASRF